MNVENRIQQIHRHRVKSLIAQVPALFTTISSRPKLSIAVLMMAAPPSGVATLLTSATASPPLALISLTTCELVIVRTLAGHRTSDVVDHHARSTPGHQQRVRLAQSPPAPVTTATCRQTPGRSWQNLLFLGEAAAYERRERVEDVFVEASVLVEIIDEQTDSGRGHLADKWSISPNGVPNMTTARTSVPLSIRARSFR